MWLLEDDFHSQLNVSGRIGLAADQAEVGGAERGSGRGEGRGIGEIKRFRPELDLEFFPDHEILKEGKIQVLGPVCANPGVRSAKISRSEVGRLRECRRVEPLIDTLAARQHRIADYVRMLAAAKRIAVVLSRKEHQRLAHGEGDDSVGLPSSEN